MHAKIINNKIVEWPIVNLRQRLPNISMPADLSKNDDLPDTFFYIRPLPVPEFNPDTHKLIGHEPILIDGEWRSGYNVVALSETELNEVLVRKAMEVRTLRNQKLSESDWTQLKDVSPHISESWSTYRQQLRNITAQPGFPLHIIWPTPPV